MQDLLSLLDAAMDDMPSGALNRLTPKEHKAQKAKEIVTNYKHNEEYIKQKNAHLSKKDSILMEFAFANPFKFNDEEMKIVRDFRKGIRDLFIIVKYEEKYTTFLSKDNLYMVKGINCNIDEKYQMKNYQYLR